MPTNTRTADHASRPPAGYMRIATPLVLGTLVAALFTYHVTQYYFLGDDCFISFRYALNLTEGHGLVFNAGEHVEGYTNFLWVLLMAGAMALGLSVEVISNVLGIAAGVGVLFLLARMGARSANWADPFIWIAPLALAVNRTFCAWSTGGLETQLFVLLVFFAFTCFIAERTGGTQFPWRSAVLFALAALTRPEGALFFGVAGVFFVFDWLLKRRRRFRSLAVWTGIFVVIVGSHVTWRYSYYGFLLPNTFYAKVSGLWIEQGGAYLWMFIGDHQLLWLIPLIPLALVLRRDFQSLLFGTIVTVYTAYLLCVGGDRFEFRFMTPILPYLFWLMQEAVRAFVYRRSDGGARGMFAKTAACAAGMLIVGAAYLPNTREYERRHNVAYIEEIEEYAERRADEGRFLRELVEEGYLTGTELVAVGGAGALPYYSRMPVLDTRGLNDIVIARQEITRRSVIGHEKTATREYVQQRGVVICDVQNRIVLPEGAARPKPKLIYRAHFQGPLRCVEARGRCMVFGTTLNEAEFRRVFARFRIIY